MSAGQELVGSHHDEAHGVLHRRADPFGRSSGRDSEEAVVRGDVELVVGRIDAETVDVGQGLLGFGDAALRVRASAEEHRHDDGEP